MKLLTEGRKMGNVIRGGEKSKSIISGVLKENPEK